MRNGWWIVVAALIAACGGDGGSGADPDVGGDVTPDADAGADVVDDAAEDPDVGIDPDIADVIDVSDGSGDAGDVDAADADVGPIEVPEHGNTHAIREQDDTPSPDVVYPAETTTYFRLEEQLPGIDAWWIAIADGRVWTATPSGLHVAGPTDEVFAAVALPTDGAVTAFAPIGSDVTIAVVAVDDTLYALGADDEWDDLATFEGRELHALAEGSGAGDLWIGTDAGLYAAGLLDSELVEGTGEWDVTDIAVADAGAYVVANASLSLVTDTGIESLSDDADVRAVDVCPDGRVLVGESDRVVWLDGTVEDEVIVPEPGGLPTDDITSVSCGEEWIAVGHGVGGTALRIDGSHVDHYFSRRWVMNDAIVDVAVSEGGARWFATADGISRVSFEDTTLAEKTAQFQRFLDDHFWRMNGFVSSGGRVDDPWSLDEIRLGDSDNDGLWTQMMVGGWAMAHAVTGDDFYCDEARRAFETMVLQIDIPCETFSDAGLDCGFITRSLVRDDEGEVFSSKEPQDNWHLQEWEGRTYYWKDDTSSDEYAGHFFGYPLYYDHCATDDERALLADRMALVMDYLLDNDLLLIDLDGDKTTHGHWNPEHVSSCVDGLGSCRAPADTCFSACYGGGFLNGAEILGALLATWHMTGEERFYLAYEDLIRTHRYDEVVAFSEDVLTLTNPSIENHSDHELMMLAFHTLLRYEPNEDRRAQWGEALRGMYDTETDERNPLWAAWSAGLIGYEFDREAAIETLRELPSDLREWGLDQSHRLDYELNQFSDRFGDAQFTEVPPYDELRPWWWNSNPFRVRDGGNGTSIRGPMAYLLAYWSARYYGLLGPAE